MGSLVDEKLQAVAEHLNCDRLRHRVPRERGSQASSRKTPGDGIVDGKRGDAKATVLDQTDPCTIMVCISWTRSPTGVSKASMTTSIVTGFAIKYFEIGSHK